MDTNHYDVVICGSELAGLAAGALLARRGFRVLILGHDAERPLVEAGPYTIPRGPALLPSLESPTVARIMKELNHAPILRRRAPVLSPPFQVATPNHRFDVTADDPTLLAEIEREFPAERAAAEQVLARIAEVSRTIDPLLGSDVTLPPDGFWERREVGRLETLLPRPGSDLLAPLPAGHPLRAGVEAAVLLGGGFGPGDTGPVSTARLFDVARRGLHRLEGGVATLRAMLLEKITTHAGEVRERVTAAEIVMRRGKAAGVKVRPRDETIGCDHVVWAGPAATLLPLIPEKPPRRLRDESSALRASCYRYTLGLLVRPAAVPEGMGGLVFSILDPGRPLIEDNAMLVTFGEPALRERDRIPLWAECLVPAPAVDGDLGYLGALRARMRTHLSKIVPFHEQHLLAVASPHDGLPAEIPGDPALRAILPPIAPTPMAPVMSFEMPRALDVGALPHATGLRGLYLGSRENLPGLGVEGELVSAWGLARMISATQPRRGGIRREVLLGET